ncbi:MAG: LysR family transcriptional regulator, partial [Raoultibacter sp.]
MHDSQLQSFLTAARYGSFNSAAKEEHLAVQSFVHRINSLEHELGFSLFSRTTKGIVLTPAGEEFLGTAQEMLNLLKAGKTRALKTADQLHETIRIGVPWRVFPLLQALYVDYQEQYPEVSIECLETSHENLFADLSQKAFDVAFFPYSLTTLEDGIESQCLASVKSVCVFQKNSDLAELETIDPVDLIGKKVLFGFDYHSSPGFQFLENWPAGVDMIPGMFPGEEVVL